ncbi:SusC/RagA family TonB-linked outer membrane protein [Mucilaginibacter sp. BJC16-A38]|uniref:SusC/RagA family TonB-linked outer membrane protein n=1 Tax=Mucilaginibacter phenanthrenivorans TaxID=1234842 RepID=UPI0021577D00|nr:SusC/RagA family TonB-linked outer membrane protein [Mucilaginibacter phenanthrenivorans]MCR8556933.1 SusC/RagA family TonB-linked outer membrane protein [Mucilaginibacter phenanthrenivorans]
MYKTYIKQFLLVMKLTAFLMLIALLQVSASTLAQKVTLSGKNTPLSTIFDQISAQTGYDFAYTGTILAKARPVTINVKNEDLKDVLDQIFQGQPLDYTIADKSVVVSIKTTAPPVKTQAEQAPIDVTGRVLDENKKPLPGATIIVKGTNNSTITGADGVFTLKKVQAGTTIVISFIGYDKKEITAAEQVGDIQLKPATSQLDAVQVIAYGQTSQRLSTGDISVVSAKEIEEQPVANPVLALEGRVPGLLVTQGSGFAGAGVSIQILGQNSIGNGNAPLYVIDGVPNFSQVLPELGSVQGSPSAFALIDPADIESISVLKDADATSIYGSRAANGAILITTKKGKAGDTHVDFNLQNGFGKVLGHVDLLNTQQYLKIRNEALKNDGISAPGPTDYDLNGTWNPNSYTDWQKALLGGIARYTNMQASVSGGNANTQFLIGVGDHRETTVLPDNFADQKSSLHLNLNHASNNQRFKLQFNVSYLFDNDNLPTTDPTGTALTLPPNAPPLRNPDGSVSWAPDANGNSTWPNGNPSQYALGTQQTKTNNLTSSAIISYTLLPGLDIKSSFGYTYMQRDGNALFPSTSNAPSAGSPPSTSAFYSSNNLNSWLIEPQLSYQKAIGKGRLEAVAGSTINQQNSFGTNLRASGFTSDQLLADIAAASTVSVLGVNSAIYKYNAVFGRINYNWNDEYIINLAGRRDGSSRFGPENRFHDFWSVGAAWIFSGEQAVKDDLPFMSFGKLSGSYGTTGNDQIGDYKYQNNYNAVGYAYPYLNTSALVNSGLPNPYLQWEETTKLRAGLDLGFFNDRLLLSASHVVSRSSNQLLPYIVPATTGAGSILENFPATVENRVWEFSLNSVNIKTGQFRWTSNFNLTIPQNKLLAFPGLATSPYSGQLVIGQPVTVSRLLDLAGVNPQTGVYQFRNAAGQLTSAPTLPEDELENANTDPKFYGGFGNGFSYGGFRLDVFFEFRKRTALDGVSQLGSFPGTISNQPVSVLQRWQNPGDITSVQRANSDYSIFLPALYARALSQAAEVNASYIRLKTLSFSWQVPENWRKALHATQLKLYAQAENLLTFTHYKGLDPETPGNFSLPPLRVITVGIQAGF